ncbi:MAG: hypothetical protein IPF71_15680 [Rhodoferax sp.]|nr:hypothetical protein [Rhodoferax sp.]
MRFRLLRRRLTISAPRMAVRSALPWPFRWVVAAVVLGFCAAIALWAFEFGKDIAGLDSGAKDELMALRAENAVLKEERDQAQSIANTSGTVLTAEKSAHEQVLAQNRQLLADNASLRSDLGFFEALIPNAGVAGIAIRGLQAEVLDSGQLKWQILVMQPTKKAPEFNGRLDLVFAGIQNGKPWTAGMPGGPQAIKFKQYSRFEGMIDLPPQTVIKSVSAKVQEGSVTRAEHSIKL